jgi:hypothetical protein
MGSKAENKVSFVGMLGTRAMVLKEKKPTIRLFLEGKTSRGTVFVVALVRGELAERLEEEVICWQEGDRVSIEGELDWESRWDGNRPRYFLLVNVFKVQKVEAF